MARKEYMFGSDNMVTDMKPYFFKIFLDGFNITEHLRIPPQFKKHVLQDLRNSSKVLLKAGGIRHIVRVVKTGNEILLKDGWKKFVRENSLGNNEFLLFTYHGNLCFTVQIFDVDGMERVSMPDPRKDQHPIAPENEKGPSHFRQPRDLKGSPKEGCFEEKEKKKRSEIKSGRERNTNLSPETSSHAHHRSSKKKTNQKENIFESNFTSKRPHFRARLKLYHIEKSCSLHIPISFARKNLPHEKAKLVLRNQKGETWEVYSIPYGDGGFSFRFYEGWGAFSRDNNLKENDVCIFELVGPKEMKVHIFRSGSQS